MTIDIVKTYMDFGITVVIALGVLWLAFKYIPKVIESQITKRKDYDSLMKTIITIAQQGNAVIERNNILMDKTTSVIDRNTQAYELFESRVKRSLEDTTDSVQAMQDSLKGHVEESKRLNSGIDILLERTRGGN